MGEDGHLKITLKICFSRFKEAAMASRCLKATEKGEDLPFSVAFVRVELFLLFLNNKINKSHHMNGACFVMALESWIGDSRQLTQPVLRQSIPYNLL
ncbi:hypothetical protein ACFSUR_16510 [Halalkalibacter alkalisediminis]|uniref:Uncharacterized protein n=1 Tax=Halalkalibacter alkalisediminis TaxID=935616 RepID=A0ABV6NF75_9BACI